MNGYVMLSTDQGFHAMSVTEVAFINGGISVVTRSEHPIPLDAGPLRWTLYGRDGLSVADGSFDVPTTQTYRDLTLDIELEPALCATS